MGKRKRRKYARSDPILNNRSNLPTLRDGSDNDDDGERHARQRKTHEDLTGSDGAQNASNNSSDHENGRMLEKPNGKPNPGSRLDGDYPSLTFQSELSDSLHVRDLQNLILYVLADGVAPDWVAIKHVYSFRQVVFILIPGVDYSMLEDFCSTISARTQELSMPLPTKEDNVNLNLLDGSDIAEPTYMGSSYPSNHRKFSHKVLPIKAPSHSRSELYSVSRALLAVSHNEKKKLSASLTQNYGPSGGTSIPIIDLVHEEAVLVEAGYKIFPSKTGDADDVASLSSVISKILPDEKSGWVVPNIHSSKPLIPSTSSINSDPTTRGLTVYSIDCEMVVTVDDAYALARISVIDWNGVVVLDKLVKPSLSIKSYHTQFSGITAKVLEKVTVTLEDIQHEILDLLNSSTILLGHSLENDFECLKMTHPFVVDTSIIYPHPAGLPYRSSLKYLARKYLHQEIQKSNSDGHDSIEDARAVLDLVKLKCAKGLNWGTSDANTESIFQLISSQGKKNRSRKTAIIGYGIEENRFAKQATYAVQCQNDEETAQNIFRVIRDDKDSHEMSMVHCRFVWARFCELEIARGWTLPKRKLGALNRDTNTETASLGSHEAGTPKASSMFGATTNDTDVREQSDEEGQQARPLMFTAALNKAHTEQADVVDNSKSLTKVDVPVVQAKIRETLNRLHNVYDSLQPASMLILYSGVGDMRRVKELQQKYQQYRKEFSVNKWDELSVQWTDEEQQALHRAIQEARKGVALVCTK